MFPEIDARWRGVFKPEDWKFTSGFLDMIISNTSWSVVQLHAKDRAGKPVSVIGVSTGKLSSISFFYIVCLSLRLMASQRISEDFLMSFS